MPPKKKTKRRSKKKSTQNNRRSRRLKPSSSGQITKPGTKSTPEQTAKNKARFLDLLKGDPEGQRGKKRIGQLSIMHACRAMGIGRRTIYGWTANDPEFAAALDDAREDAVDDLEQSMYKRAFAHDRAGVTAGIFLLKGNRPERYHDRVHGVHTGPGGEPIQVRSWVGLVESALQVVEGEKADNGESK